MTVDDRRYGSPGAIDSSFFQAAVQPFVEMLLEVRSNSKHFVELLSWRAGILLARSDFDWDRYVAFTDNFRIS